MRQASQVETVKYFLTYKPLPYLFKILEGFFGGPIQRVCLGLAMRENHKELDWSFIDENEQTKTEQQ